MNAGWIGGIVGGVIGVIGGIVGTYFSITHTNGPRERAFMIKASVVCWMAVLLFVSLMVTLPTPYRYMLWIPSSIMLPFGIRFGNRRQQSIRREEVQGQGVQTTQETTRR